MTRRSILALALVAACVTDTTTGPDLTTRVVEPVIAYAAGDIAGRSSAYRDLETSNIIMAEPGAIVLLSGDNAYPDGTALDYAEAYHPTWGRFKDRTWATPGNHEYHVAGAPGYFGYFGDRAPAKYYAKDLGNGWRWYFLNTELGTSGVGVGSPQYNWLRDDLAANPRACVGASWHRPLYTSGSHSPSTFVRELYRLLYDQGADLIVWGHNHQYERFKPQDADGHAVTNGVVAFTSGAGGAQLTSTSSAPAPNTVVRINGQWGVLRLALVEGGYSFGFKTITGTTPDQGTATCSGASEPPPPPPPDPEPSWDVVLNPITPVCTGTNGACVVGSTDYRNVLTWSPHIPPPDSVDVWKDGVFKKRELNDGKYANQQTYNGPATFTYKLCQPGSATVCTNSVSVTYQ